MKVFVLAGRDGIVYDFFVYSGSKTFSQEHIKDHKALGVGGNTVVHLCKTIQNPTKNAVCFDNYFTSIPLITYLDKKIGLKSVGTIRANRVKGCPMPADKDFKKGSSRGDCVVWKTEDGVAVVKWLDSKSVNIASSWAGKKPTSTAERWDKRAKKKIDVMCPRAITLYNANMGGVDLLDIQLHRLPSRSKRWPNTLFAWLVDMALVNAYLLYRNDQRILGVDRPGSSKDYRLKVSLALLDGRNDRKLVSKRGRPSTDQNRQEERQPMIRLPLHALRYDGVGHFPDFTSKKRCRHCKSKSFTSTFCTKCNVRLCLHQARNCFLNFHRESSESAESSVDDPEEQ